MEHSEIGVQTRDRVEPDWPGVESKVEPGCFGVESFAQPGRRGQYLEDQGSRLGAQGGMLSGLADFVESADIYWVG